MTKSPASTEGNRISSAAGKPSGYIAAGGCFLILWILSQMIPPDRVIHFLDMAVERMDGGYLLASAVVLVFINSVRAIALYLGWFLLGEGATGYVPGIPSWFIPLIAIPFCYSAVSYLGRGIVLHFGSPAVMSIISVLVLHFMTREVSGWINKSLALAMFVFSFQWFDIVPVMTAYGAGHGELSLSIKTIAQLIGREGILNITGFAMFFSLFLGGIIISELLIAYGMQIRNLSLLRENEKKLAYMREENIRSRSAVELQQLVHDLKRPLTTIIGLTDVVMSMDEPAAMKRHTSVIAKAANNMNDMVSEILHAGARRRIRVSDLVNYTRNQISPFPWKDHVEVKADENVLATELSVNLVRFSRALVNLLDNSHRAVTGAENPAIKLLISAGDGEISIMVEDNGPGFGRDIQSGNYSGWNSTGIGLGFVGRVVQDNGGTMRISDAPEGGGCVEIRIPTPSAEAGHKEDR